MALVGLQFFCFLALRLGHKAAHPPGLLDLWAQLWAGWIPPAALVWGLTKSCPPCEAWGYQNTLPLRSSQFYWSLSKIHSVPARASDVPHLILT